MDPLKNPEVFISYANQDKGFVNQIALFFKNNGLDTWVDETDIKVSEDYLKAIEKAIISAKVMIVVLSNDTNKSDFVKNEIRLAINNQLKIIVFKVENNASLESLEFFLGLLQHINAYQGDFDEKLEKLYVDCCVLLKLEPSKLVRKKQKLFSKSFSFRGRIGRLEFDLSLISYITYAIAWTQWAQHKYQHFNLRITLVDSILYFLVLIITNWFILAQLIKRCHDISKSAWYVINPLFIFVLPFQKGVRDKNRYGYHPKESVVFDKGINLLGYYALATCVVCFGAFLFSPNTDSHSFRTMPLKKGFKPYQTFDYTIQYPAGWGVDSSGKTSADFIAYAPMGPRIRLYQENIAVQTDNLIGKGLDLKTFMIMVLGRNQDTHGQTNTKLIDTMLTTSPVNKMKYYKVLTTYDIKSSHVTEEMNVYFYNNMAYGIAFTYSNNASDKNKVLARQAMETFIIKNIQ